MSQHTTSGRLWRSRWAAVGAAVAVTLGAGGLFAAHAADESSVVTIDPVRVVDTRVDLGITGPLKSLQPQDVKVTGTIETAGANAIVVPDGANGIVMNLSVVRPSARGFISVRPGGATGTATTASLNFEADDITGNAVIVNIPTTGADIGEFNLTLDAYGVAGPTTDVTVDIVGYTTDGSLGALASRLDTLEMNKTFTAKSAGSDVDQPLTAGNAIADAKVFDSVSLQAPSAGTVVVDAATSFYNNNGAEGLVICSISTDSSIDGTADRRTWVRGTSAVSMSTSRSFEVAADEMFTANLVCYRSSNTITQFDVIEPEMTAVYVAD